MRTITVKLTDGLAARMDIRLAESNRKPADYIRDLIETDLFDKRSGQAKDMERDIEERR